MQCLNGRFGGLVTIVLTLPQLYFRSNICALYLCRRGLLRQGGELGKSRNRRVISPKDGCRWLAGIY